jgi:NAD+ synthase
MPHAERLVLSSANLDYERISRKIVSFLKFELRSSNREGYVLGLSGGLDSSVVAHLLHLAGERTFALVMPSSGTPKQDMDDAVKLAESMGMQFRVIELADIHARIMKELPFEKTASGNLLARIRMCLLYYHANQRNSLVAGTSDRSELLIGYFTKYGDGGADILPIGSLYKTQVRALGSYLKLPDSILAKKSAPMLWEKHTAEEEIGMPYEDVDKILHCLFDLKLSPKRTATKLHIDIERVERIGQMHAASAHKMKMPKICRL